MLLPLPWPDFGRSGTGLDGAGRGWTGLSAVAPTAGGIGALPGEKTLPGTGPRVPGAGPMGAGSALCGARDGPTAPRVSE